MLITCEWHTTWDTFTTLGSLLRGPEWSITVSVYIITVILILSFLCFSQLSFNVPIYQTPSSLRIISLSVNSSLVRHEILWLSVKKKDSMIGKRQGYRLAHTCNRYYYTTKTTKLKIVNLSLKYLSYLICKTQKIWGRVLYIFRQLFTDGLLIYCIYSWTYYTNLYT